MKKISTIDWLLIVLVTITFIVSFIYYPNIPDIVPTHWNASGQIDGWGPKWIDLFLLPIINLGILIMMIYLPQIDPLKKNYQAFKREYDHIKVIIVLLFAFIYAVILKALTTNTYFEINSLFTVGFGVFFFYLGHLLPRVGKNWFVGIKTPWTLASDTVWKKTHLLAGKLFMIAGVISIVSGLTMRGGSFAIFIPTVMLAALIPTIYSYFLWRNETKLK